MMPGRRQQSNPSVERRLDPSDGKAYTYAEFQAEYRDRAPKLWAQAGATARPSPCPSNQGKLLEQVEALAEAIRDRASQAGQYVDSREVERNICRHFNVTRFAQLGVGWPNQVKALAKLQKQEADIHLRIQAYKSCRVIGTLSDLELEIVTDQQVSCFADLRLGPLLRHPLVLKHFRPGPTVSAIPECSPLDIIEEINKFQRSQRGKSSRFRSDDVLGALATRRQVASPAELCCLPIRSLGWVITNIADVKRREREQQAKVKQQMLRDMEKRIEKDKRALEKNLKVSEQKLSEVELQDQVELISKQAQLFIEDIVNVLTADAEPAETAGKLFNMMSDGVVGSKAASANHRIKRKNLQRLCAVAAVFVIEQLSGGSPLTGSHVGIRANDVADAVVECARTLEAEEAVEGGAEFLWKLEQAVCAFFQQRAFTALGQGSFSQFLAGTGPGSDVARVVGAHWERGSSAGAADNQNGFLSRQSSRAIEPAAIVLWLEQELDERASQAEEAEITPHHHQLEQNLCSHFDLPSFEAAGLGSFLEFLIEHPSVGQLLACQMGWSSAEQHLLSTELAEFVHQCRANFAELTEQELDSCIQRHFGTTLSDMKAPEASTLLAQASDTPSSTRIRYLGAIPTDEGGSGSSTTAATVGQLGYQDRNTAIRALASAPVLIPLQQCLLWRATFESQHGPLGRFLAACTDDELPEEFGEFLELEPNLHVRIDAAATRATDFRDAVTVGDVHRTVVTLTSIISISGTSQDQLLKTYCGQSFNTLRKNSDDELVTFVFDCLQTMPSAGLRARLAKILTDPLSTLVPDYAEVLLGYARCDLRKVSLLHELGFALGVDVWCTDFSRQMVEPAIAAQPKPTPRVKARAADEQTIAQSVLVPEPEPEPELAPEPELEAPEPELDDDFVQVAADVLGSSDSTSHVQAPIDAAVADAVRVVNDIRLNPELKGPMLARAMEKLSIELYSKDVHFVMELIQNADDNSYSPDVSPSIEFVIAPEGMVIKNNEVGFTEKNIRAICEVGMSTKGAGGAGFIGQKGIGFKSVFKVTDQPAIRSRGFSICFKRDPSTKKPNMLLPHLCPPDKQWSFEEDDSSHEEGSNQQEDDWTTTIMLPFKHEIVNNGDAILQMFSAIRPSLLLFLNKLRHITVHNRLTLQERTMSREDDGDGLTCIRHDDGVDTYLVVSSVLHVEKGLRGDATATKLACAFPTSQNDVSKGFQSVFAFLPVASYGFRFIVQGDFIVSSSRETIRVDSGWNQYLLSALPDVFMSSFEEFKRRDADGDPMFNINSFFEYVPQQGEVRSFFKPVVERIHKKLCGTECIPTATTFMLPSQVIFADASIRHLIPEAKLSELLGLHYAREGFVVNDVLAKELKLPAFSREHLVKYLEAHAKQELVSVDEDYVRWVAQLIHCLYRLDHGRSRAVDIQLCSINFIPLQSGSRACLKDRLFLPLDRREVPVLRKAVNAFISELPIVDERLTSCLSDVQNPVVLNSLRKKFGVEPLSLSGIVESHILPQFMDGPLHEPPLNVLHGYWSCLKLLYEQSSDKTKSELLQQLSQSRFAMLPCVRLDDSEGSVQLVLPKRCHFSSQLGNSVASHLLETYATFVPHSCFGREWRKFLSVLGVADFVHIEEHSVDVPREAIAEHLGAEKWRGVRHGSDGLQNTKCGGEVLSYIEKTSQELRHTIEVLTKTCALRSNGAGLSCTADTFKDMQYVLSTLNQQWDWYLHACETAIGAGTLEKPDYNRPDFCREMRTEFGLFLGSATWLPGVVVDPFDPTVHTNAIFAGADLWEDNRETRTLLHIHVPYFCGGVDKGGVDKRLMSVLGVKQYVTASDLLCLIRQWADKPRFRTNVKHMGMIYAKLMYDSKTDESVAQAVGAFFSEEPCIFVPFNLDGKPSDDTDGKFYKASECSWADPSRVIDMLGFRVLTRHYGKFTQGHWAPHGIMYFFVRQMCADCQRANFGCVGYPGCCRVEGGCQDFGISRFLDTGLVKNIPSVSDYVAAMCAVSNKIRERWESFCKSGKTSTGGGGQNYVADSENKIRPILQMLTASIVEQRVGRVELTAWRQQFWNQAIWPVGQSAEEGPMFVDIQQLIYNDSPELAGKFETKEGVHLLQLSNAQTLLPLLDLLGVPHLSQLVETRAVEGMIHFGIADIEEETQTMLGYAQRYLIVKHSGRYSQIALEMRTLISELKIIVVEDLAVYHTLTCPMHEGEDMPARIHHAKDEVPCQLKPVERLLHIARDTVESKDYSKLAEELARLFDPEGTDVMFAKILASVTRTCRTRGAEEADQTFSDLAGEVWDDRMLPEEDKWRLTVSKHRGVLQGKWVTADDGSDAVDSDAEPVDGVQVDGEQEQTQQPSTEVVLSKSEKQALARLEACNSSSHNPGGSDKQAVAWPSGPDGSMHATPATNLVAPAAHLVNQPLGIDILQDAARSAGLAPCGDDTPDVPLDIGGGHGISGGHGIGRGPRKLLDEEAKAKLLPSDPQATIRGNTPLPLPGEEGGATRGGSTDRPHGDSDGENGNTAGGGHVSAPHTVRSWLPRRHDRPVTVNGHTSLAPLSRMLPPPWNTAEEENSVSLLESSSTQLANEDELRLLQERLPSLDASEIDTSAVGRWGEQLAFSFFSSQHATTPSTTKCVWVNQDEESGLPYDIRLDDELTGSSIFVEVKTTVTTDRQIFPISGAELLFAQDHEAEGTYWVVRVYGGGTEGVTMRKVESLMSQVEQGAIGLLLVL